MIFDINGGQGFGIVGSIDSGGTKI